jgi:hypothetical protein
MYTVINYTFPRSGWPPSGIDYNGAWKCKLILFKLLLLLTPPVDNESTGLSPAACFLSTIKYFVSALIDIDRPAPTLFVHSCSNSVHTTRLGVLETLFRTCFVMLHLGGLHWRPHKSAQ